MPKSALAIRHVAFEDLGTYGPVLARRGYSVRTVDAPIDDLVAAGAETADVLVVLGGPIGAYEDDSYPFLAAETALIARRLAAGRPTLGVCLGAQIMARALGARVYKARVKELGFAPLRLTDAGHRGPLRHLDPALTPVLHWHGDTFDLPKDAVHLAATDICPNQAFALGHHALALQFHVEVSAQALEAWLVGHTLEIATTSGANVGRLRADAHRFCPKLTRQSALVLEEWLDGLA